MSTLLRNQLFDPTLTGLVYGATQAKSPLRKLWQDIYISCGSRTWFARTNDEHADFPRDLNRRLMGFWQVKRPQEFSKEFLKPCKYHEHKDSQGEHVPSASVSNDETSS